MNDFHETEWAKHHRILRGWLDIDDSMKSRPEYYWGWYCKVCHAILGKKGQR